MPVDDCSADEECDNGDNPEGAGPVVTATMFAIEGNKNGDDVEEGDDDDELEKR